MNFTNYLNGYLRQVAFEEDYMNGYYAIHKDRFKYHYAKKYWCDHPLYNECTLFEVPGPNGKIGLAVIQQRFDHNTKSTYWGPIDPWLEEDIYSNGHFMDYAIRNGGWAEDGLYPTVTIRQLMFALGMRPLKRERWETYFDRRCV